MTEQEKLNNRCLGMIISIGLVVLGNLNKDKYLELKALADPLIDEMEAREKEKAP